jgi:hypothetical protein
MSAQAVAPFGARDADVMRPRSGVCRATHVGRRIVPAMGSLRMDLWRQTRRAAIARAVERVRPSLPPGSVPIDARRPGTQAPVVVTGRPASPLLRHRPSR